MTLIKSFLLGSKLVVMSAAVATQKFSVACVDSAVGAIKCQFRFRPDLGLQTTREGAGRGINELNGLLSQRLTKSHALKVLGLPEDHTVDIKTIRMQYKLLMAANQPTKGFAGSPYIQARVYHAYRKLTGLRR